MPPDKGFPGPGKHQDFQESTLMSRFRLFFTPGTAIGVAVVVVLLTVVGVVRALTWDGAGYSNPDAQSGSSISEASAAVAEGTGGGTVGSAETSAAPREADAPGYGLSGDAGAGGEMLVHVTGAVVSPGVVRLASGARVIDAVESAGGLSADADISGINLAAFASDGSQIHVSAIGEAPVAAPAAEAHSAAGSGGGCIDLNTASERELEELNGVGPKIAARIVAHRSSNGPFASSSDLMAIPGIGAVLSQKIGSGACQ